MHKTLLALVLILFAHPAFAVENLLFKPLTAHVFEPRVGAIFNLDQDNLRLDIGTSIDLFTVKKSDSAEVRIGGDFFTYTRLRTAGKFKFPVETSDYFFGVNLSGKSYFLEHPFEYRFRLAHISSHLVDGYSNNSVFKKDPFVYSREFIEGIVASKYHNIRLYAGLSYIFSTQPKDVGKFVPQLGFEIERRIYKNIYATVGEDFKVSSVNDISRLSTAIQMGVSFKSSMGTGIGLYYYGYNGWNVHGMFYDEKDRHTGIGFQLLF